MRDAFSNYHPLVNFVFFTAVILCSMFFMHPVCLGISLACSMLYSLYLNGRKTLGLTVKFLAPMMLITALVNPAFNHRGVTILTYLPGGNPLTLESILYGIAAASMLACVILWFSCYNKVMTSDKFIYLFGRLIPGLSLIFSMALRFVPRFRDQFHVVSQAQKCVGRDVSQGTLLQRARNGVTILSIMVTWSLENAIETSDSMRSRGYGLPGRTAFSIFRLTPRDGAVLGALAFLCSVVLAGSLAGAISQQYYPILKSEGPGLFQWSAFASYLLLCLLPMVINLREDYKWKRIQSKI